MKTTIGSSEGFPLSYYVLCYNQQRVRNVLCSSDSIARLVNPPYLHRSMLSTSCTKTYIKPEVQVTSVLRNRVDPRTVVCLELETTNRAAIKTSPANTTWPSKGTRVPWSGRREEQTQASIQSSNRTTSFWRSFVTKLSEFSGNGFSVTFGQLQK